MSETPAPVDFVAQAKLLHENGPYVTPPATLFFTYLKPDGESIIGPATSAEMYLREGFTITGEQTIEDFTAFTEQAAAKAEKSAKAAPKAEPHEAHARTEKPAEAER